METLIEIGGEEERERERMVLMKEGRRRRRMNGIDDVGGWRWPTGRRRRRRRLGFVGGESLSLKRAKEGKEYEACVFYVWPEQM